jgi:hypothetical protein
MNNPDHISESLETIFPGLKYLISFMRIRDPGWKKFGSGINTPGSATLPSTTVFNVFFAGVFPKIARAYSARNVVCLWV